MQALDDALPFLAELLAEKSPLVAEKEGERVVERWGWVQRARGLIQKRREQTQTQSTRRVASQA